NAAASRRMGAGAKPSGDDGSAHGSSESIGADPLDREPYRLGRMPPRLPSERLQAGNVVAEIWHVAGPAAVAGSEADRGVGPAGGRDHDLGDLAHRSLADSGGVIDRQRAGRFFPSDQNGVDEVGDIKIGLGLG